MKKILFLFLISIKMFGQGAITELGTPLPIDAFDRNAMVLVYYDSSDSNWHFVNTETNLDSVVYLLTNQIATKINQDTLNSRISRNLLLLQDMENRQSILQDSINVLNQTQLVIKGILTNSKTTQDSTLENVKENNIITQDIENRIAVLQDSLNVLNSSINVLKGYLDGVETNQLTQITRSDTSNNRLSQVLVLLQYIRAAAEILDNVVSGSEIQTDIVTMPDVDINDISKGTQTNDVKITMDSEVVAVDATGQGDVPITLNGEEVISKSPAISTVTVLTGSEVTYTQLASNACKRLIIYNTGTTDLYVSFNDGTPTDAESIIIGAGFAKSYIDGEITDTNVLRLKGDYKVEIKN